MSLERITAKRTWFVPDILICGTPSLGELEFLACEGVANSNIYFGTADIGVSVQEIEFSYLTDHRGNQLPAEISAPRVIIRSRSTTPVFLIGAETDTSFKIARDPNASASVMTDLYIIEMGA
jgi:hypothetical protein